VTSQTSAIPSVPGIVFWSVTPATVAVGVVLLMGFSDYTFAERLVVVGIEVLFALIIVVFASPHRYHGAARLFAGCAAALYVLYFVDGMIGKPGSTPALGASAPVAGNAVLGLLFFALPCAIFAIRGSLLPASPDDDRSATSETDDPDTEREEAA
jgi:hypothetical protein